MVMIDDSTTLRIIITMINKIAILYYFLFNIPLPNGYRQQNNRFFTSPMVTPPLPFILHYRRLLLVGCCVSPRRMAIV